MEDYRNKVLWNKFEQTDVQIMTNNHKYNAHRAVLSAHSSYFRVILSDSDLVRLPCVSSYAFSALLEYMYSSMLRVNCFNVYELLFSAQFLQMQNVIIICQNFLANAKGMQSQENTTTAVLKPIPEKATALPPSWKDIQQKSNGHDPKKNQQLNSGAFSQVTRKKRNDVGSADQRDKFNTAEGNELWPPEVACCDGPVQLQKVPNVNYVAKAKVNDKRQPFYCIHCRYSFKSYYCYEKHKRRHINPEVDERCMAKQGNDETAKKTAEINVPFFPCKCCGLKFPSYYFVHKHRKVCPRTNKDN